jgi:hypothetical protein
MPEPISMKLCMYIIATEPISTAYFVNLCYQSLCLYVYPSYRCKATARWAYSFFRWLDVIVFGPEQWDSRSFIWSRARRRPGWTQDVDWLSWLGSANLDYKDLIDPPYEYFRLLDAGLSPRGPGFDPSAVHVRFVADTVSLGQVLLWLLFH